MLFLKRWSQSILHYQYLSIAVLITSVSSQAYNQYCSIASPLTKTYGQAEISFRVKSFGQIYLPSYQHSYIMMSSKLFVFNAPLTLTEVFHEVSSRIPTSWPRPRRGG